MPNPLRLIALLLVAAALSAPLSACGKRGTLEVPEGGTYPRTYPTR